MYAPALMQWSDDMDMESMILATDARYAPLLILMGVIIPFVISWGRCKYEKSEADKSAARADGTEPSGYSPSILGGNAVVALIGVLAVLCIPGMYYGMVGAEQDAYGMYLIGLATSIFFGWFGDKLVFLFLESKRNGDKTEDALATAAEALKATAKK